MNEEMIQNAIKDAIPIWVEIFSPIVAPILVGSLIWGIVKLIARKFVYFFSIVSGDTRRETKRKLKISDNLIDLSSSINDIKPKK